MRTIWRGAMLLAAVLIGLMPAGSATQVTLPAGIDLSGLEFGAAAGPGTLGKDYVMPTTAELDYYRAHDLRLVRLPVAWERLQPGLFAAAPSGVPSGAFDAGYLDLVRTVIAQAHARGMTVLVDVHNYGGYGGHKLGDAALPARMFAELWRGLAARLGTAPGLAGYDLMNEPSHMPTPSAWPVAAQAAVDAIRAVDTATPVYVEGDCWAGAGSWNVCNPKLAIADTAGHLVYEAHVYGDRDASGTHFTWAQEAAHGVTVQTIAQRVAVFAAWCQAGGHRCVVGEIGVGSDAPEWNQELEQGLTAMAAGGLGGFVYWAGGPWWGHYPMSLEPQGDTPAPQMAVVSRFAG